MSWECSQCGTKNDDSAKVCKVCGKDKNQAVVKSDRNDTAYVSNKSKQSNIRAIVAVIGVLILGVVLCFVFVKDNSDTNNSMDRQQVQENTSSSINKEKKADNTVASTNTAKQKQSSVQNETDASLDDIKIDDDIKYVRTLLGMEQRMKTSSEGLNHYYFKQMEVVCRGSQVVAMVSETSSAYTSKGIKQGDSLNAVLDKYGSNYMLTDYDDLSLYEYNVSSISGNKCILRFAVNKADSKVNYISIRTVE